MRCGRRSNRFSRCWHEDVRGTRRDVEQPAAVGAEGQVPNRDLLGEHGAAWHQQVGRHADHAAAAVWLPPCVATIEVYDLDGWSS
jgi:hypothetical protein